MRRINNPLLSLTAIGIVLILLVLLVGWVYRDIKTTRLRIGADQKIDITPQQIQSIKEIGEWEFLSISDEEMVDTIRHGIFSDDHLVRIYYGTMRLGVNLKQVEPGWIVTRGDTIEITLPQISLLDHDFIDEARTKSFYESGSWTAKDREAMLRKAYQMMLRRGMTRQNLQIAEQNGQGQVRQVMQGMGFKHVKILYKE
ncbi:DUF4230 domain-containing protein [Prevotella sp. tf2-5]|jgi:hypothetical protein|uniref:DUF4230 domain-containing protein n=1 Tax=Prevotella sp. tf2-5 TaxID=1761889 RepID=UPI000AE73E01|nr:DUF4230 domain-containing protein [Prevotella sp. tf2-5]MCR5713141.1 DUF4230 domain-containing protein [Prevotella sp.]